ncbi:hypothetical protein [Citrobacter sp.]|uniref:hypothetical protein n=1 Tax=Citrobacter sp. TaxID=1896336 RepID=UPI002FC59FA7
MATVKGALEGAVHNIGRELLLTVGDIHKLSGRSDIKGSDLAPFLERLIEIHSAVKLMEPTCKGIDELLATLGGRALAPTESETAKPSEDKA